MSESSEAPKEKRPRRKAGVPQGHKLYPTAKEWDRFWKRVTGRERPAGCWLWTGAAARYGFFGFRGETIAAHRVAYRAWPTKDAIPPERPQLDHRCRNGLCVNPEHLEPVTNKENSLRGIGFSAVNARKLYCPKGHRYSAENTLNPRNGKVNRHCRICTIERARETRRRLQTPCGDCGAPALGRLCKGCTQERTRKAGEERRARKREARLQAASRQRHEKNPMPPTRRGAHRGGFWKAAVRGLLVSVSSKEET